MSQTAQSSRGNRVKITDAFCRRATPKPGQRTTVYSDTDLRGFCLVVTAGGSKTFAVRYTLKDGDDAGKQARVTLGPYLGADGKAVATYRTEAAKIIGDAARGVDKAAKRKEQREGKTVAELCKKYLAEHAPSKRSGAEDARRIEVRILPEWRHRKVSGITRSDVRALLAPIEFGDESKGQRPAPYEAWALLRLIKKLFNFGIDEEIVATNPAARMKLSTEPQARERSLDRADELRAFWALTEGEAYMRGSYAAALRFQLLTGSRPGEVVGMRWDEIDLEANEWTLPRTRSKNKREHLLPLTPTLRAIIDEQAAAWDREQAEREAEGKPRRPTTFVFPALRGGRYTDRNRALILDRALEAMAKDGRKLERFTPHDLRRTAETLMASAGVVREHRDRVLNHVDSSVGGKHYNRHDFKIEKREALETLERAVEARLAPTPDNVTEIRGRRRKTAGGRA